MALHETIIRQFLDRFEGPDAIAVPAAEVDQVLDAISDAVVAMRRGESAPLAVMLLEHVRDHATAVLRARSALVGALNSPDAGAHHH